MKSNNPHCRRQSSLRPANLSLDPGADQAFCHLRLHAEELALELAVRLRVVGKSLAAGCYRPESSPAMISCSYPKLRQQMERFLDESFTEPPHLPVVRNFIVNSLPAELNSCTGGNLYCPIQRVETAISLLSEEVGEPYGHAEATHRRFRF